MALTYLLLGSNIGDSVSMLSEAAQRITVVGTVVRKSALYKTAPWGNTDQPAFFNQLLEVDTDVEPHQLMARLLQIESEMGRKREKKWEPRVIDIDILFYDDRVIEGNLNIPHPLLQERRFALEPLQELIPEFIHPRLKRTVAELLAVCPDQGNVEKL